MPSDVPALTLPEAMLPREAGRFWSQKKRFES